MPKIPLNYRSLGGALVALSGGALFADLTWLRVLFAVLALTMGLLFILRAAQPQWFQRQTEDKIEFGHDGLMTRRALPPRVRWERWGVLVASSLLLASLASWMHYTLHGGQKTQSVIAISGPAAVLETNPPAVRSDTPKKVVPKQRKNLSPLRDRTLATTTPPIVEMDYGNLKAQSKDLAYKILCPLYGTGFGAGTKEDYREWNLDPTLRPDPSPPRSQQDSEIWYHARSRFFYPEYRHVVKLQHDLDYVHISDEKLDDDLEQINDQNRGKDEYHFNVNPAIIQDVGKRLQVIEKQIPSKDK